MSHVVPLQSSLKEFVKIELNKNLYFVILVKRSKPPNSVICIKKIYGMITGEKNCSIEKYDTIAIMFCIASNEKKKIS